MSGPAVAQQAVDFERSGTLSNVRVAKPTLAFGASADLTFNLEYLVRVTSLMGSPIINCGLRVRDLRGSAEFDLSGERQKVQITAENSADVAVLHLGFVLHRFNLLLADPWVRTLSVRCQPGVIARDDSQPFNVPANPGLDRFFCANAAVPDMDFRNELPDMLGPDWCSDMGGTFMRAEEARALFRKGIMVDDISNWGAFGPHVVAFGIGIAELIGNERQRLAELSREADQDDPELDTNAPPDPSSTLARLAAERARIAQEAATDTQPRAVVATDQGDGNADLVAARAQAQQVLDQARRTCRANRPTPLAPEIDTQAVEERERVLAACRAAAPRVPIKRPCRVPGSSRPCPHAGGCLEFLSLCTQEDLDRHARIPEAQRARRVWEETNTCEADAIAAERQFIEQSRAKTEASNRAALESWEASASACEARAETDYEKTVADAEAAALRVRSLRRLINP